MIYAAAVKDKMIEANQPVIFFKRRDLMREKMMKPFIWTFLGIFLTMLIVCALPPHRVQAAAGIPPIHFSVTGFPYLSGLSTSSSKSNTYRSYALITSVF